MFLRNLSMGVEYHVFCHYDVDGTYSTIPDPVSTVHYTMCNLCMGGMDSKKFRNVGKLHVVGKYRQCSTR